ncbi:conserved hypothetical protein [Xanthomonas citri pv. aurantifolii str. ICPB 11122]|nr:conserved hypothetical protein [Xanthomonas citri pv. aurantifolii str. ICPB 11122]
MRFGVLSLALTTALLASAGVGPANAKEAKVTTLLTTQKVYSANAPEVGAIRDWITKHSPEYQPLLKGGVVTVKRTGPAGSSSMATASQGPGGPPVPLPASGLPGETFEVTQTYPNGGYETWIYVWGLQDIPSGLGDWQLQSYKFDRGKGDVPNNLPEP